MNTLLPHYGHQTNLFSHNLFIEKTACDKESSEKAIFTDSYGRCYDPFNATNRNFLTALFFVLQINFKGGHIDRRYV